MEKTVREWLEKLNEPERSRALANLGKGMENKQCDNLYDALCLAFYFHSSPEGIDYWDDIADRVSDGTYVFDRGAVFQQSIEERIDRLIGSIDRRMEEQNKHIDRALKLMENATGVVGTTTTDDTPDTLSTVWVDILENFDWEMVRKIMVVTNWTWYSVGGVPTVNELKKEVKGIVERIYPSTDCVIEVGGFRVTKETDKHGMGTISVEFVARSWSVDFDVDENKL